MRILFIHQNFPGQFKLLANTLAQQKGFEVVGMGDAANLKTKPRTAAFPVLGYPCRPRNKSPGHHYLASFRQAARREIESRFSFRHTSLPAYMDLIATVTARN